MLINRSLSTCVLFCALSAAAGADVYTVSLDESLVEGPVNGRLILCFITEDDPGWANRLPLEAPFYEKPQPMAGIDVENLEPGGSVIITDEVARTFPRALSDLEGVVRVQAVLRRNFRERSFVEGEGNLFSDPISVELHRDRVDRVEIRLRHKVPPRTRPPAPADNLHWVDFRSERLSTFRGHDVFHRAGVVLPNGYDDPQHANRRWPTIYVVPGFSGREDRAINYAIMMRHVPEAEVPQAVWIVVDPETPLGHHGFCDSENNGPVGSAFVEEFIPHLESKFRLDPRPAARILYGHSSGGWSVLWLQLTWPEVFGATWSSAPDPIDFTRFQMSNLHRDRNLYEFAPGQETPSYREVDFDGRDVVFMTVREECLMEQVIDPRGRSGEQWDAWTAMWSPRDPDTGVPRRMFDPETGEIDREVVEHWKRFDIRLRLLGEWETLGPVMRDKVRLFCGEFDNFYLERAVRNVKMISDLRLGEDHPGAGYVEIVEFAGHGSLVDLFTDRMHREMQAYLKSIAEVVND